MQGERLDQINETKNVYRALYIASLVFVSYWDSKLILDGFSLCFYSDEYLIDIIKDTAACLFTSCASDYCYKLLEDFDKHKNVDNSNVRVRNRKI